MRKSVLPNIKYSVLLLCCLSLPAMAQGDRARTWDVGVQISNLGSANFEGQQGSGLSVDSEYGFGFWGTYNFTNRLGLGFDFNWTQPKYDYTYVPENSPVPQTIQHRMDMFTVQGKGVFYFIEGPISPFVEAGIGWTSVDSNIADGPPTTGCWWDPWWGYVCRNFYSTYSDTRTSYSAAIGLRWDLRNSMTLRGSYGLLEVDTSSSTEDASMDTLKFDLLWRF
ncbi:MAG: porin family protein [Pseudomonadales bacterium]